MCSESDFEKLWFMYKTQGEPKGVSINKFCVINNLCDKQCPLQSLQRLVPEDPEESGSRSDRRGARTTGVR